MASQRSSTLGADLVDEICLAWNIPSLKDYQESALTSVVIEKRDCIVCVPTGSGKSLCFEALCMAADHHHTASPHGPEAESSLACQSTPAPGDGMILVISPLVSLVEMQVNKLKKMGISAVNLCTETQSQAVMSNLKSGKYR